MVKKKPQVECVSEKRRGEALENNADAYAIDTLLKAWGPGDFLNACARNGLDLDVLAGSLKSAVESGNEETSIKVAKIMVDVIKHISGEKIEITSGNHASNEELNDQVLSILSRAGLRGHDGSSN